MRGSSLSLVLVAGTEAELAAARSTAGTVLGAGPGQDWELLLVAPHAPTWADGPTGAHDRRLHWVPSPSRAAADEGNGPALQAGLDCARGRYVGVLGAGDVVEPGVLPAVVAYLRDRPTTDVLYTDEQWAAAGTEGIFTKPHWNPEYLLGMAYLGRLCLVRRELLVARGGFTTGRPGAEEWDAHLRVTAGAVTVEHIPAVGVTRAVPPATTAAAQTVAEQTVTDHLARLGVVGQVEAAGRPGAVRVWRRISEPHRVSVVIPTIGSHRTVRGTDTVLVVNCVRSLIERATYQDWELVLVTGDATDPDAVEQVRELLGERLTVTTVAGPFNFAVSVNEGVRVATGDMVLLLNDDTEAIEPRWLERMIGVLEDPTIGVVGARLLLEDGRIQHIGVHLNNAWEPDHAFQFEHGTDLHFGVGVVDVDVLAVTGACLLTRRSTFVQVGGLTPALPLNFNDVDLCFKVVSRGYRVVSTPAAVLHHYESSTRAPTVLDEERAFVTDHWRGLIAADPWVNLRSVR